MKMVAASADIFRTEHQRQAQLAGAFLRGRGQYRAEQCLAERIAQALRPAELAAPATPCASHSCAASSAAGWGFACVAGAGAAAGTAGGVAAACALAAPLV